MRCLVPFQLPVHQCYSTSSAPPTPRSCCTGDELADCLPKLEQLSHLPEDETSFYKSLFSVFSAVNCTVFVATVTAFFLLLPICRSANSIFLQGLRSYQAHLFYSLASWIVPHLSLFSAPTAPSLVPLLPFLSMVPSLGRDLTLLFSLQNSSALPSL